MSWVKKWISGALALVLLGGACLFPAAAEDAAQADASKEKQQAQGGMPVEVKAKSAVLMDTATGKVLLQKNGHERLHPASVTKIMTLLLVVEAIDKGELQLTDTVTASADAVKKGGSQIWLKEGEQMTVDELLKAAAVASANDASAALAEKLCGSEEVFVAKMNARAKELGMNDTNFENCTGLDDTATNHLTSAYDIALMSRALIGHELIKKYSTIWMDSLRGGKTELVNTNKLVRFYNGCTGLKTGTTSKAGSCLAATATRENTSLVAVVMGSETSNDRFDSAKAMLNWGFANYELFKPELDLSLITDVKVIGGESDAIKPAVRDLEPMLIQKGTQAKIVQNIELAVDVQAPVEEGQVLGKVTLTLAGQTLGEYMLTAPEAVAKLGFFTAVKRLFATLAA